ncbi:MULTISPECIES: LysE family translocator [unclassified Nocardioides]|uniref:LysE family translocator n=1 Tax=unclassified Nocardioides TaxID=2615069 RepID=UPI0006F50E07|nr:MULTISPECIES: LysE family translocator [unclassified Nocardioides]KQY62646.1 lysine transporter LysE [Nocardioides sp. Root140]KRF15025.1 lysine transporter LysE [Nocardioides sp. Soil796]
MDSVPSTNALIAFVIASILFIQVPGPSLLFTIGRALTVGRREALLSVLGNALGLIAQVLGVALGLGALVAASAAAYTLLKLVGAAYVVYLGVQAIRHRADARRAMESSEEVRASGSTLGSVWTGFLVGATNPKSIVFFAAFLPQFVDPTAPAAPQLLLLGAVFGVLAVCSDSCWALAASRARDWFARKPQRLDRLGVTGGVMMVGLGAGLAATGNTTH